MNFQMQIPAGVAEMMKRLQESGYQAYLVGGCVRDYLLGQIPKDIDITTSATPEMVKELFPMHPQGKVFRDEQGRVIVDEEGRELYGMTNIGTRPTVSGITACSSSTSPPSICRCQSRYISA